MKGPTGMSDLHHPAEHAAETSWQRFWNKGGWWKSVLVAAVYIAIYLLLGFLINNVSGTKPENVLSDPLSVFFGLAVPILVMGALTYLFICSLGWTKEIFGKQPVTGRWWMWIAVVLVLIPNVMHLVATNWSAYGVALVLAILFLGLCVGFSEELLTRGVAVNLLRRAGHTERSVMLLSATIFGLLHSSNIVSGQNPITVGITVLYTFGFGAMMYLSMRATGSIIWAILLHASTDPSTILATGGIDAHSGNSGDAGIIAIAGFFNYAYILAALVAIFLVRGKVDQERSPRKHPVSKE